MSEDTLDILSLGPYLEENIKDFSKLTSAEKFSWGQSNPTYLLHSQSGQYVLRRQPFGELLKSAHAVDREYRIMKALADTDVPVPTVYHLCEEREIIGSMFFVMSFENGQIFWDPTLPTLDNNRRTEIYREMNRVLAALHDIDIEAAGLADFGRAGNYFERQISRWTKQYRASETETVPSMDILIDWLAVNIPEDDGKTCLIHGDFRLDNIIFHSTESHALALLDWELSTLGHPYADVAYQCMQLRLKNDAVIAGLGEINRKSLGIPNEEEYIEQYCKRRKISAIPDWNFYLAFSFFRFAAILQGVLKRALEGNASSKSAFEYGKLAPVLANMAVDLIDGN